MARPTTLSGSKLLIELGDGNVDPGPEEFAAPCALNSTGINLSGTTQDFEIADCDDLDAPVFVERVISALSAGVSGSGTLAMESFDEWRDWMLSGVAKNIRVKLDTTLANNGGYFSMSAVLTTLNITRENVKGLVQVEVELSSNGEVVWTDASA
ncbi:phage tail protein [Kaustia mangrovi]|uniref:Phage tail protein n=1 Tax=Kaustia mangrovi TaxID=2593653 RepID=A0A7S8C5B9_9HYPH|nr:phage tail tube protein [Kaustia mangrovi]QPC43489.1 phage tail protein [Kaustia mangrovi]